MRLFAKEVMPVLKTWKTAATPALAPADLAQAEAVE
jgi:hypothetical protein